MKLLRLITAAVIALTVAGCGPKDDPVVPPPPEPDDPVVPTPDNPTDPTETEAERLARLGQTPIVAVYFTEYTKESEFPTLEDVKCFTHINIGHGRFVNKETGDGGIVINDPGPSYLKRLAAYKKDYPELKLLLMIGGWGKNANGFSEMARSAEKRKLFCDECVRLCKEYNLDGIDLDWEYPTYAAEGNGASSSDTRNFSILVKEMRAALGKDKLISYAASDNGEYINNKEVLEWVDYINVMTYSMGDPPYHNSPLYRSALTRKRSGEESIEIFHNQGVPYDRMNYGIGFYGHGDGKVYPSSVQYYMAREALEQGTANGKSVSGYNKRWWDDTGKNCYLGDASGTMYASYEDVESITWRVKFLKDKGMLGAFAWEYREDDSSGTLRRALRKLMNGETPDNPTPSTMPVMGSYTRTEFDSTQMNELSGLCFSKDKDFMWGVGDEGALYKITFDMKVSTQWTYEADMEGITIDPATGDLYMAIEPKRVYKLVSPYTGKTTLFDVSEAVNMGNSGMEGIAWYKGNLYIGAQTGATLWQYKLDGTKVFTKKLGTIASGIKEVGDLCYDEQTDCLWVSDSEAGKLFVFDGAVTKLLATYDVSFIGNAESVLVDHVHKCVWVGDDGSKSRIYKISFTGL